MNVKKGLGSGNTSSENHGIDWFRIAEGDAKTIRFLTEGDEIISLQRHFVKIGKFKGSIMCLNNPEENKFDCPLCRNAGKDFGSPISEASERCYAVIIDRETGEPKFFEGTKGVYGQLSEIYRDNKSITNVDYMFSKKKGKNAWIEYKLSALINTARPLTKIEKDLAAGMDLNDVVKSMSKSPADIKKIIEGKTEDKPQKKKEVETGKDLDAVLETAADDLFEDD